MILQDKVRGFLGRLLRTCPALPYLALGIWLAWLSVASNSTAWLSNTETDGYNLSTMCILSTLVLGAAMVVSVFFSSRTKIFLQSPAWVIGGGALSSFGCFIVIIIGPYYLTNILPDAAIRILFYLGSALSGLGAMLTVLKCGTLYSNLTPRKVILYTALSFMIYTSMYFIITGLPDWQPIAGGPSLAGIIAFVGLPLLAALCVSLGFYSPKDVSNPSFAEAKRKLPRAFWKLLGVVVVFSIISVTVRAALVAISPIDATLDNSRLVVFLCLIMALVFAVAAIGFNADDFNFGKIYSIIMSAAVAIIAFIPIVGVLHVLLYQTVEVVFHIFEFVLWCVLAFVVYQKRISPIVVYGFGYGLFMLGSGFGWVLGAYGLANMMTSSNAFGLYSVLAFIVLACSFVLFSEREFDNLFKPKSEGEPSLDDLFSERLPQSGNDYPREEKRGKFGQAIDELAQEYGLSQREKDVLRLLAMGYDSTASAKKLQVSWNTVRTHTRNLYAKLSVHSHQELISIVDKATSKKS